jgi:septal ring factor EnvC (AmiA/AmiB activator)
MCRKISLALLFCAAFAYLSAQQPSSLSTGSEAEASPPVSTTPAQSLDQLDSLLSQLESAATDSQASSQSLRGLLSEARTSLTRLSSNLESSQTLARELSSSLALSAQSLAISEESLRLALRAAKSREVELWITRAAVLVGVGWAAIK